MESCWKDFVRVTPGNCSNPQNLKNETKTHLRTYYLGGREGGWEGGREGGRERGREGGREIVTENTHKRWT